VVLLEPSPKLQLNEYGWVPPDTLAVKVTICPTVGFVGLNAKLAVRITGLMVMLAVLNALAPLLSVTVAFTV
jgi:hypothetical protein